jgi:hypothetical protein
MEASERESREMGEGRGEVVPSPSLDEPVELAMEESNGESSVSAGSGGGASYHYYANLDQ